MPSSCLIAPIRLDASASKGVVRRANVSCAAKLGAFDPSLFRYRDSSIMPAAGDETTALGATRVEEEEEEGGGGEGDGEDDEEEATPRE